MASVKTRLDFVVLNHDEDLIGVTLREQLTGRQRRQQAVAKNTVIETVLVAEAQPDDHQLLGKPDLRQTFTTHDLEAAIIPK